MPKSDPTPLLVGQFWRRWSDDLRVSILEVDDPNGRVRYKGLVREWKLISAFRREFRCVIATGYARSDAERPSP